MLLLLLDEPDERDELERLRERLPLEELREDRLLAFGLLDDELRDGARRADELELPRERELEADPREPRDELEELAEREGREERELLRASFPRLEEFDDLDACEERERLRASSRLLESADRRAELERLSDDRFLSAERPVVRVLAVRSRV